MRRRLVLALTVAALILGIGCAKGLSDAGVVGGSKAKKTATSVGAGAVIGSIIGAIAGGGRGAAIGAGVGAAGGGVYAASTRGEQVKVPAETLLDFKLEQPATITVPPHTSVSGD